MKQYRKERKMKKAEQRFYAALYEDEYLNDKTRKED